MLTIRDTRKMRSSQSSTSWSIIFADLSSTKPSLRSTQARSSSKVFICDRCSCWPVTYKSLSFDPDKDLGEEVQPILPLQQFQWLTVLAVFNSSDSHPNDRMARPSVSPTFQRSNPPMQFLSARSEFGLSFLYMTIEAMVHLAHKIIVSLQLSSASLLNSRRSGITYEDIRRSAGAGGRRMKTSSPFNGSNDGQ